MIVSISLTLSSTIFSKQIDNIKVTDNCCSVCDYQILCFNFSLNLSIKLKIVHVSPCFQDCMLVFTMKVHIKLSHQIKYNHKRANGNRVVSVTFTTSYIYTKRKYNAQEHTRFDTCSQK